MKYILMLLSLIFISCTVNVSNSDTEYCMADYYCSYYNNNGNLVSGYFCEDEITSNMTCK